MRKILVPVSYMCSGSSAVTDFLREFENVKLGYDNFEFVFLHCPNGVFDLEDQLLVGNNALRSDESFRQFLARMKDFYDRKFWWQGNYKKIFGSVFYPRTEKFVDELIDYKLDYFWYMHELPNAKMIIQLFFRKVVYYLTFKKVLLNRKRRYNEMLLGYPTPEEFYLAAKKYIKDILNMLDNSNNDLILDQLVLPFNLFRVENYFDDNAKFIVVERDPRDVFLSTKYIWTPQKQGVPYAADVVEFCEQYRKIRQMEKPTTNKNILRIKFEDLIYKYDETTNKIIKFLNFEKRKQINKKKYFDPDISIKGTQLFKKKEYQKEGEYIADHLKEYLYDFPSNKDKE